MSEDTHGSFAAVFARELRFMVSDRWTVFVVLLLPAIFLVIVSSIFLQSSPRGLPLAVVDLDHSAVSRRLIRKLEAVPAARLVDVSSSKEEGWRQLRSGAVLAVVEIPAGLERAIRRGEGGRVYTYFNDSFYTSGNQVRRGVGGAVASLSAELGGSQNRSQRAGQGGDAVAAPVRVSINTLFNPQVSFEFALVTMIHPAILHLMALCAVIGAVRREADADGGARWFQRERLLAPLLGKLAPYVLAFWLWNLLCVVWIAAARGWTVKGSVVSMAVGQLVMYWDYALLGVVLAAVMGETCRALSAGSFFAGPSLAYANTLFPTVGAPLFVQWWSSLMPFTAYMKLQTEQWQMGAPVAASLAPLGTLLVFLLVLLLLAARSARRWTVAPRVAA